jgi:hypothetical protein
MNTLRPTNALPLYAVFFCTLLGALTGSAQAQNTAGALSATGERRALLIGVDRYDEGCPRAGMSDDCFSNNLYGPTHDVDSLKQVLERSWGFRPQDITVLLNADAKRAGILRAFDNLLAWAKPGGLAVIYFSGHGTSPQNSHSPANLPAADTGALVVAPEDIKTPRASYLVGRTDIRPVLAALDAKGVEVFAAFDACFSQNTARSAQARSRVFRDLGIAAKPNDSATDPARASADDSPYRHVYYLSAAGAAEPALEIDGGRTYDGQVHGAFTDAMLRVLSGRSAHGESHSGSMSYDDLADAVEDFMRPRDYGHTPVRMPGKYAADRSIGDRPLLEWGDSSQVAGGAAASSPIEMPGIRVRVDPSAAFLDASLRPIRGLRILTERESEAEYLIRGAARGQVIVTTPGNEPIYGAGGLDGAYAQDADQVVRSFALRAALRKLFESSEAHRGGLALRAGFTDGSIGETVAAHRPVALAAEVSSPAQLMLLHLMGDGSTHVWLGTGAHNPECMQGLDLAPGAPHVLCQWGGAEAPFGLDLLYVIAMTPAIPRSIVSSASTFDMSLIERLTAAANIAPASVAVREIRFYTVLRK